jgi:hypothetical protein
MSVDGWATTHGPPQRPVAGNGVDGLGDRIPAFDPRLLGELVRSRDRLAVVRVVRLDGLRSRTERVSAAFLHGHSAGRFHTHAD